MNPLLGPTKPLKRASELMTYCQKKQECKDLCIALQKVAQLEASIVHMCMSEYNISSSQVQKLVLDKLRNRSSVQEPLVDIPNKVTFAKLH